MNIDYSLAGPTFTPAQVLYQTWKNALEAVHGEYDPHAPKGSQTMFWGVNRNIGIGYIEDPNNLGGDPTISLGDLYGLPGTPWPKLTIRPNGMFRLGFMWGWEQRSIVERNSFLAWSWQWGRYHWYVLPEQQGGTHYRDEALTSHWTRHGYVAESLLLNNRWNINDPSWAQLVQDPDTISGWDIVFAAEGQTNGGNKFNTQDQWDRFALLREKRYNRSLRAWEISEGLRDKNGRRIETEDERNERLAKAAKYLSAHFVVSTPARTTPLRKFEEEGLWPRNGSL